MNILSAAVMVALMRCQLLVLLPNEKPSEAKYLSFQLCYVNKNVH
jgi:hypothetical protein